MKEREIRTRVYTKEQILAAQDMYMNYKSLAEICAMTGMSIYAVKFYSHKYWRKERQLSKSQILDLLGESRGKAFAEISLYGMELLVRSLKDHAKNGTVLTIKESFALSHILSNIDKMVRLDSGEPTDIIKDIKPADRGEIIQLIQSDPFYKQLPANKNHHG